jgi:hypothetical protein
MNSRNKMQITITAAPGECVCATGVTHFLRLSKNAAQSTCNRLLIGLEVIAPPEQKGGIIFRQ